MYNYLEGSALQAVEREKAVYEKMLSQYQQLLFDATEGVYEISVRSHSGLITVPVNIADGISITHILVEAFSNRVDKVEENLNTTLIELGNEAEVALNKKWLAKEALIEEHKRNLAVIEQRYSTPALAEQAATTAAPIQKVGRPRKAAKPQAEVMKAVGALAAQVPMNGSTANAAARATGSTPQG